MNNRRCHRCGQVESIPETQTVECAGEVMPLCHDCWEEFRTWFHEVKEEERVLEESGAR